MGTGAIGGVQGVLVAAGQAAGGRSVGVHLPMCFTPPPICTANNEIADSLLILSELIASGDLSFSVNYFVELYSGLK